MPRMRASRSSGVAAFTWPVVAIAPALIIGLTGRPVALWRLIALKASPLGSTPTLPRMNSAPWSSRARPYTNGFEIDWMVNSCRVSPAS